MAWMNECRAHGFILQEGKGSKDVNKPSNSEMQSVSYQKATETGEKRVLLNYHTCGEDCLIFSP